MGINGFLILFLLPLCSATLIRAQSHTETHRLFADIAISTQESGGVTIFWADAASGAIYSKQLTDNTPPELTLKDFSTFFRSPELPAPSALAYHEGKLFVCDVKAASLYEIDVESGKHRVLLKSPVLEHPTAVLVPEQGSVAIADSARKRVVWYVPGKEPRIFDRPLNQNSRIDPASTELLAFLEAGSFIGSDSMAAALTGNSEQGFTHQNSYLGQFFGRNTTENFGGLTYYRGIYYVAFGRRMLAFAGNGSFEFPLPRVTPFHTTWIAASDYRLFVADGARKTLLSIPRPIPVKVSFESGSGNSRESLASTHLDALASLYQYLASRKTLATRVYTVPSDTPSLYGLLIQQKVIFSGPDDSSRMDALTESARKKFARLLCDLNPDYCATLPNWNVDVLSQKVNKGQRLKLPNVAFVGDLISSPVDLKGKSIKDHLKERVTAAQRKKISPKDLLKINASFKNTFEGFLSHKEYILAEALKAEIRAGSVIRFDKGQEVRVGDLRKCTMELRHATSVETIKHPGSLTSRAVEAVLPWRSGLTPESLRELQKLGVSEVEISFDKLTAERLHSDEFFKYLPEIYQRRCLEYKSKQYVVGKTLKAAGTRYTLRRDDGTTMNLGVEELQRLNLHGQPDPTGESSFIVNEPLSIGYRLLQNVDHEEFEKYDPFFRWRELVDHRDVKPNSPQNILNQTRGVFELPVTRWKAHLFVHAEDLRGQSGLREVTSGEGIYVLSEQGSALKGSSLAVGLRIPQGANTLEEVRRYREQLKGKINYIPPDASANIEIGIGEDEKSIDFSHSDFYDKNGNAWYKLDSTLDWTALPKPAGAGSLTGPLKKDFSEQDDHGSHVAGLLAARPDTVAGLLPEAELFLINNSSVAKLEESIEAAIKRGIYIFNFSFTTNVRGDDTFGDLRKKMRNASRWRQRLFVVASGNDNKDLRYLTERFAISWAANEANILGVGASDGSNNFLGQWTDPSRPDQVMPGSNWSKEHVHLLAPGKDIWSTASGNKYAAATGSSMAVPQVTAAAAMLHSQGVDASVWIKIRLIYTADWFSPQFDDKVWGGQLNYKRAVWQPMHNLLSTQAASQDYSAIEFDEKAEIEVHKGEIDDRRNDPAATPKKILLKNILRIQRLGPPAIGLFNVIYLQEDGGKKLRVLRNAEISGRIPCRSTRKWEASVKDFGPKKQDCGLLDVSSTFYDYVARVPRERHDTVMF